MGNKLHFSEATLHDFWLFSTWFDNPFVTTNNKKIEVVRRGTHNKDAGPDILSAILKIDGCIVQGDIEIHLKPREWYAHQHQDDEAYNRVVLHIALEGNTAAEKIVCENGSEVLQYVLPASKIEFFLEEQKNRVTAYQPTCQLKAASKHTIVSTLQAAGIMRFQEKVERFSESIQNASWDQVLYAGICEALGYSKNQEPFRRLAQKTPIDLLFSEMEEGHGVEGNISLSALLFGAAGFLKRPEGDTIDTALANFLDPLIERWNGLRHVLQIEPLQVSSWKFFKLRPQNFPTRRIAALIALIQKFNRKGMLENLSSIVMSEENTLKNINMELRQFFIVPATDFWIRYNDFKNVKAFADPRRPGALIGRSRADDLVVNVVLPILLLYASSTLNAKLENRIWELLRVFPALQHNHITKKMGGQLCLNRGEKNYVRNTALIQQGTINLHKNWCSTYACQACVELGNG